MKSMISQDRNAKNETISNNYFRYGDDNSCQKQCGLRIYVNEKANTCDFRQVFGCEQCLQNQRCVKCSENLNLDDQFGCVLCDNICDQQQFYSLFLKQCSYQCSQNEIKDQYKLCVPIQNYNYFQETQSYHELYQITACLILYRQWIFFMQNPQSKTIFFSTYNFIDGNIGGCQSQNMKQNLSKLEKSTYQFIYESYKNKYYYWEFVRLFYKSCVMVCSILLQDYLSLKTCLINQTLIMYNYIQMKINPFVHQLHNQLQNQSILISITTLNFCLVQSLISTDLYTIIKRINQQTDSDTIFTEFDSLKQAQLPLILSRYSFSPKFKSQVQDQSLQKQETTDFSQIILRQSNIQFRLINIKEQFQDEVVEEQKNQIQQ
ncbi:hypothetical protein ABPG74_004125 [Tetrahymena malaccensis]